MPLLAWQDLYQSDFNSLQQFRVNITTVDELQVLEILRHIPQRRIVVYGLWQGKNVIAKLFLSAKHSRQHMLREYAGYQILHDHRVPTAKLEYYGATEDAKLQVIFYECLTTTLTVADMWQQRDSLLAMEKPLKKLIIELATQHVLGIVQQDLHLKNFIYQQKKIFTVDTADIKLFPHKIPQILAMQQLALLVSQLGVGVEALQILLFETYAHARGWLLKPNDQLEFFRMVKEHYRERWRKFNKKIFRASTQFAKVQFKQHQGIIDRAYRKPELEIFLQNNIDSLFQHPQAVVLKNGRSATVIKLKIDDREIVIKRYNMKNIGHWLRRFFRPTRAATSWRLAQKLQLFGIATPKPIAYIEKKCLGMRSTAYYFCEYYSGVTADEYFQQQAENFKLPMVKKLSQVLRNLAKLMISHGDLKLTNILINEQHQPVLIDLDGTKEHLSLSSLRAAWRDEIARFLKNFEHSDPAWYNLVKMELER